MEDVLNLTNRTTKPVQSSVLTNLARLYEDTNATRSRPDRERSPDPITATNETGNSEYTSRQNR